MNARGDRRVLLVENDENDELLALRAFRASGVPCEIDVARDGEEAIESLRRAGERLPALVMLDLNLPRIDGHEVLKAIRADSRTHHLPVVVFSSSREAQDVLRAYRHGASSYICKPVDYDEFLRNARVILTHWLELNLLPDPRRS